MFIRLLFALTGSALLSLPAAAGLNGEVSFDQFDQQRHRAGLPVIMKTASECMAADLAHHRRFFSEYGISPFYGDQSTYGKAGTEGKRQYLSRLGFSSRQVEFFLRELKATSCIGLALKCLSAGFRAAGQEDLWEQIREFTVDRNDVTGDALLHGLQVLGWRIFYWNPDVSRNEAWDAWEQKTYPGNPKYIWGYHADYWRTVQKYRKYLYNRVDDLSTLVNFGRKTPGILKAAPFFVGMAHGGYHVFPGSYGQIIEAHSTRQLNDPQTVETSPFNPLVDGGGPRGIYRSGIMAIPPIEAINH